MFNRNLEIYKPPIDSIDSPRLVVREPIEGQHGFNNIVEGFANDAYMIRMPKSPLGTSSVLSALQSSLEYYRARYPEGLATIKGEQVKPYVTDEDPWKVSYWTNYGEQHVPYRVDNLWGSIVDSVGQERSIERDQAERAVRYLRVDTPFANFGFEPDPVSVKDVKITTAVEDTAGFESAINTALPEEKKQPEIISQFLSELKKEAQNTVDSQA